MTHRISSLFIIVICFATALTSQQTSGTIEYGRTQDWVKIMSNLPYMTQEEIDRQRLTWGKNTGRSSPYILYFNEDESLYTYKEQTNENGYSWKRDDFVLIRDYEDKTIHDKLDFLGRTYVFKEEAPKYRWKILNEIKEVAGYLCMKAETVDTVKDIKIYAWFTDQIPVYGGPEGFYGLPGMILGLDYNDGDVIIEAKTVEFSDEKVELPIPKKIDKGRTLTIAEKNKRAKEYIAEAIEGRKNPYWQMRY